MRTEGERLAAFSRAVRASTLARLRRVPPGRENWRLAEGALSLGDVARHLIDADRWLFDKLEDPALEPMVGEPYARPIASRQEFEALLVELERSGEERARLLERLSEERLREPLDDARFGGEVSVWWTVVRGNLEHEAHHRGQIAACLRALGA